ncbi:MAG: T9SS type A sorting domain-containing protein [Cyclobacteriaceae bacterium]|nr:T9SS type A sorting domain-containing protein [Cyclobacteriaceae bacterium]MDW8331482.1 T9SS type A sorting domain-containing protein [Cyclobacteriaceae bacterium]
MRVGLYIVLFCVITAGTVRAQLAREFRQGSTDTHVSVYPNPAVDDYVYVRLAEPLDARLLHLHLYNIIGNEIPVEAEVLSEHEIRIRIKELSAGYYLLGLQEERTRFKGTYKFLKR